MGPYGCPAHGHGWEGQSPPKVLGHHTMLDENMTIRNEAGAYTPELDFGHSHSDVVLVGSEHGMQR